MIDHSLPLQIDMSDDLPLMSEVKRSKIAVQNLPASMSADSLGKCVASGKEWKEVRAADSSLHVLCSLMLPSIRLCTGWSASFVGREAALQAGRAHGHRQGGGRSASGKENYFRLILYLE